MMEILRSRARNATARIILMTGMACLTSLLGPLRRAEACGGTPPPPSCGKTLVLAKAVPQPLPIPGGGVFNVQTLVFFQLLESPPGSGVCPQGPYAVDISLTATCNPAGFDGAGAVAGVPITPGFNLVPVPVTMPPGPARSSPRQD
jgi:hypothetical protein